MKILHTSDWHLGKIVLAQSMLEDQQYFIEQCFLPALDEYRPDVIVLAGDIYDRSIAPLPAIALFEYTLYEVARRGIPLIAIAGNHDSAERLLPAARLMRSAGIYLANTISDCFSPIDIKAADGSAARFFPLPYCDLSQCKAFLRDDEPKSMNDAYAALFTHAQNQLASDRPNILITHCTVTGAVSCESESRVAVGGAEQVSSELFGTFGFTCLGHIHSPQRAGKNVMYSGAPLRYSFDVNERDKSMLLIDMSDGISYKTIPVKPRRAMRTVTGTFEELLNGRDEYPEDYIFAVVNDDHLIYEPMTRLREKYPHILGMSQTYLTRAAADGSERDRMREKMTGHTVTDREIFTSFLHEICDIQATPDDIAFFEECCAATGEDET